MPGKILGLQIDDDAVSAVVVKSGFREAHVAAWGRVPLEEGGLDEALGVLAAGMDLHNDATVASVPAGRVSLHTVEMPFSDPKKIRQALPYEIESLTPFSIDTRVTDFIPCGNGDGSLVLAASVASETVAEILSSLHARGLDAQVLELDGVPAAALLLRRQETVDDGVLLHIGIRRHTMVLFAGRRVVLVRSLGAGVGNGSPFGALLHTESSEASDPEELGRRIEKELSGLARRMLATIHAWSGDSGLQPAAGKIYFSGPGALYTETGRILERETGIAAEPLDIRADRSVHIDKAAAEGWNPALMNGALALALRDPKGDTSFNFRRGAFEKKTPLIGSLRRLKAAGVMAGLFLVLWMVHSGLEYSRLQKKAEALEAGIEQIFRRTFPEATRIVDPLQQMKVRVTEEAEPRSVSPGMGAGTDLLGLILDISERIPENLNVRFTVTTIDQDSVRISGRTDDFNMVDGIKNSLEPSAYFSGVTISSANMDRSGDYVQFELRLERAKGDAG